ncbi:MAG TPA: hypothetical protein VJ836_00845 [Candidatus Saccharimonadales bacterium]|nr:hypothetical protein [Candidatus Saccharimonadales bacterium]
MNLSRYNKFWVALAAAAGVLLFACAPDAETGQTAFEITTTELYQALVAFAGSIGVYQVRNTK